MMAAHPCMLIPLLCVSLTDFISPLSLSVPSPPLFVFDELPNVRHPVRLSKFYEHFNLPDTIDSEQALSSHLGSGRLQELGFVDFSRKWFWIPGDCLYTPSSAIGLFSSLKRKGLLESVAHTLLFEIPVLRGGHTFDCDQRLLGAFDLACSLNGPFYALKDTSSSVLLRRVQVQRLFVLALRKCCSS